YQIYSGIAAPINFNGLVRQYYLRKGENVADIQVNFVSKNRRELKSHALAKIIRGPIQKIGDKYNANIKIAEVPPGPPVMSTLVAEVYGPDKESRREVAKKIKEVFKSTKGVVDVDWYVEDDMKELHLKVDKEKAALTGISTEMITRTAYAAVKGSKIGILHTGNDREEVDIVIKLPESKKSYRNVLSNIMLTSMNNKQVPLNELVKFEYKTKEKPVYQKNLKPVTYVTGDVAGVEESPVYAILDMKDDISEISYNGHKIEQYWINQPENINKVSMKWDGEWQITYEVFRDLGLAFAAVLVIMYFLLVAWFRSFATPIIMMLPIPLSLLGIIPGHYLFGEFFTATSMIGFIALAGIMVRNAILLIDFIENGLKKGKSIKDSVIESGAIRTRPVFLTAITVVVGALFMLPDPIFAGLGVSLIMGALVSTVLTLVLIPMAYYVFYKFMSKFGWIK
ncbi:efflux RND transporter permease subunit, partial [Flexistipes sinusarabici]|uniref:efflux RND transporter permease subunit n=1 Tax=Flexistipes sinusarabici TaxID=2352 RepID=UPI0023532396